MKTLFLFPYQWKKYGAMIFTIGIVLSLWWLLFQAYDLDFFYGKCFAIASSKGLLPETIYFKWIEVDLLPSIIILLNIAGGILFGFSKEKEEDEYIAKVRTESLLWAIHINYVLLFISCLFVFQLPFLWVVVFNMFTPLWLFIIRFNWWIHFKNKQ